MVASTPNRAASNAPNTVVTHAQRSSSPAQQHPAPSQAMLVDNCDKIMSGNTGNEQNIIEADANGGNPSLIMPVPTKRTRQVDEERLEQQAPASATDRHHTHTDVSLHASQMEEDIASDQKNVEMGTSHAQNLHFERLSTKDHDVSVEQSSQIGSPSSYFPPEIVNMQTETEERTRTTKQQDKSLGQVGSAQLKVGGNAQKPEQTGCSGHDFQEALDVSVQNTASLGGSDHGEHQHARILSLPSEGHEKEGASPVSTQNNMSQGPSPFGRYPNQDFERSNVTGVDTKMSGGGQDQVSSTTGADCEKKDSMVIEEPKDAVLRKKENASSVGDSKGEKGGVPRGSGRIKNKVSTGPASTSASTPRSTGNTRSSTPSSTAPKTTDSAPKKGATSESTVMGRAASSANTSAATKKKAAGVPQNEDENATHYYPCWRCKIGKQGREKCRVRMRHGECTRTQVQKNACECEKSH
jgi:hypothetical protein